MKAFPKVGLLAVVALLATAAVATSAQAVSINPAPAAVSGQSGNSSFSYGVASVVCDNATANGITTTTTPDRISNVALAFNTNCAVPGVAPVTVTCTGTVTLIADPGANDTATLELNNGFQCTWVMSICTITVAGPQTTQPDNLSFDEANDNLNASVDFQATRSGSTWCGPASGIATFAADYAMTPANLTIDP